MVLVSRLFVEGRKGGFVFNERIRESACMELPPLLPSQKLTTSKQTKNVRAGASRITSSVVSTYQHAHDMQSFGKFLADASNTSDATERFLDSDGASKVEMQAYIAHRQYLLNELFQQLFPQLCTSLRCGGGDRAEAEMGVKLVRLIEKTWASMGHLLAKTTTKLMHRMASTEAIANQKALVRQVLYFVRKKQRATKQHFHARLQILV